MLAEDGKQRLSQAELSEIMSDAQIAKLKGIVLPAERGNWDPAVPTYYHRLLQKAKILKEQVEKDERIDPVPVLFDLYHLAKQELTDDLYEYAVCTQVDGDDLIAHSLNVTFTSLVIGRGLGYDTSMLSKLGLAAFVQDVGMYKVPPEILRQGDNLSEEEIRIIKEHPKVSFGILSSLGKEYTWLAEVALQVHERANGSGYPYHLKEEDIYEISFVIGIADMYVALISNRPYGEKLVQTDAVQSTVEEYEDLFPLRIRRALLDQISLYPVYTYVKLNTNAIGRVVRADKELSIRPTVEVLYDKFGNKLKEPQIVDLSQPEHSRCGIVRGLSKADLPGDKK